MAVSADPYAATLAKAEVKVAELDAKLREVNGTLKDLRDERRRVEELLGRKIDELVDTRFEAAVTEGLEDFGTSLDAAIAGATQGIFNRFDLIAGVALGEDAANVRKGGESLEQLVRQYVHERGGQVSFPKPVTG